MFGLDKYVIYGILAAITIAVFSTFVIMWKSSIKQSALLEYNNKQLETVMKEQQKFIDNMNKIYNVQKETLDLMNKKNNELADQLQDIEIYLNSDQTNKEDRPSSNILKETIKKLGSQK